MRRFALALALVLGFGILTAPAQAAWQPEKPAFGVGEQKNVAVTMSDGVVLRANVFFPVDPKSGKPADGKFPVIMVQTP